MDDRDKFPSQLAERFQVRLPDGMRDQLREAAEKNNRSMNSEIVVRLQHSLSRYASVEDNMDATPNRSDSITLRLIQKIEKTYNDLCERLEAANEKLAKENEELLLRLNSERDK